MSDDLTNKLANAPRAEDFPILLTPADTKDKIYIVTGANQNLGLEAARYLVQLGASKVILTARNLEAGKKAVLDIESTTGITGVAEVWHLDLASYESVKSFAKKAVDELDRIDVVIQNAGISLDVWSIAEGHEMCTTVNVYSTVLLAVLLLPKLKETGLKYDTLPHLVDVGTSYAFQNEKDTVQLRAGGLQSLDVEADADMANRYAVSKMIGMFATFQLAQLVGTSASTGVVISVVCPGLVKSNLTSNLKVSNMEFLDWLYGTYGREPAPASRAYLHAVNAGRESHGMFVRDCQIQQTSLPEWFTDAGGRELQSLLWDGIEKELRIVAPGVLRTSF